MLRGDLANTRLDEVLRLLATDQLTGRLALSNGGAGAGERTAEIYVAKGDVYAAWLGGPEADPVAEADARLRLRLLAEGTLAEEAWDDARTAQEELFDWSIGELLVELGHLDRTSLERVATEELLDAVAQTDSWRIGSYRFRRREKTRNRAGRTFGLSELLEAIAHRTAERVRLAVSAAAVPTIGENAADSGGLEAAVLGLVDGARSVAEIEVACGTTGLEVATMLRSLADRGHVVLPVTVAVEAVEDTVPVTEDDDPVSRWSALLDATLPPAVPEEQPRATVELVRSDLPPRPVENLDPETAQRRARLRARAAEELLAAQAEVEALREAELARAVLADELSVVESLLVVEDAIEQLVEPAEASAPSDSVEAVESDAAVELIGGADSVAEAPAVEGPVEEPTTAVETTDVVELGVVIEAPEADAPEADAPEAVAPEAIAPSDLPVAAVQAEVEPAATADEDAIELPEQVLVEEAIDEPASDSAIDPLPEPIVDLVAEELLEADLPLAEVAATAAAQTAEQPAEEQPEPTVAVAAEIIETVDEQAAQAAAVDVPAAETPMAEAVDVPDASPADEPVDEHDPALAAALMRELSSLGLDDEPAPAMTSAAPRAPRVPAPRHAAPAPSKKKRGIFGR